MFLYSADLKTSLKLTTAVFTAQNKVIFKVQRFNRSLEETKDYKILVNLIENDNFLSVAYGYDCNKIAMADSIELKECNIKTDDFEYHAYVEIEYSNKNYPLSCKGYLHPLHNSWKTSNDPVHAQIRNLLKGNDFLFDKSASKGHQQMINNAVRHYLDMTVIDKNSGLPYYPNCLSRYAKALFLSKNIIKAENWETYSMPKGKPCPAEYNQRTNTFWAYDTASKEHKQITVQEVENFYFDCQKNGIDISNIKGM